MSKPAGSPRGTINLYPAGSCPSEMDEKETEEKKDNRGSIGQQLERIQKIAKKLVAINSGGGSIYEKNLHPYVDTCPRDNTPHLFTLYEETPGFNTSRPGYVKLLMDGERIKNKSLFEYFGPAIEFVSKSIHAIPELSHVFICQRDMVSESIYKILAHEYPKIGVSLIDNSKFHQNDGEILSEQIKENPRECKLSPSERSKLQDGYHKLKGFPVASKRGRILRIALYVAKTPEDEKENDNQEWAIFPDKPTKIGEPDTIAKFPTRDKAVAEMHKMEKGKTNIDTEDIENKEVTIASESLRANIMHDWLSPEEAAETAWSLREKSHIKKSPEEEEIQ